METVPRIKVEYDYDGFFESFIRSLLEEKKGQFKHHTIVVDAGPYRAYAVKYESKEGVLRLDFYSPLRHGFGSLSDEEIKELVELL